MAFMLLTRNPCRLPREIPSTFADPRRRTHALIPCSNERTILRAWSDLQVTLQAELDHVFHVPTHLWRPPRPWRTAWFRYDLYCMQMSPRRNRIAQLVTSCFTLHGHVSVPCAHIIVAFFAVDDSDIDGVSEWQVLHRYPLTHHDDSVVMSLDS